MLPCQPWITKDFARPSCKQLLWKRNAARRGDRNVVISRKRFQILSHCPESTSLRPRFPYVSAAWAALKLCTILAPKLAASSIQYGALADSQFPPFPFS